VVRWLNEKWPDPRRCLLCGDDNWQIGHRRFEVGKFLDRITREDLGDDSLDYGRGFAVFVTVGRLSCGHIHLFDAETIGVTPGYAIRERSQHERGTCK
jgi:hypothetical protein